MALGTIMLLHGQQFPSCFDSFLFFTGVFSSSSFFHYRLLDKDTEKTARAQQCVLLASDRSHTSYGQVNRIRKFEKPSFAFSFTFERYESTYLGIFPTSITLPKEKKIVQLFRNRIVKLSLELRRDNCKMLSHYLTRRQQPALRNKLTKAPITNFVS